VLIHRHDAPLGDDEWRAFLADHDFGELIAPGAGRDLPVVVPTHFLWDGKDEVVLHLARPNPVWGALAERPRALLSVFGAYTYIPGHWNQDDHGVPTSYYAAVQLACDVAIIDEPGAVAAILERQLAHFQPEGKHAPVTADDDRYGKLLPNIRGIRLTVTDVRAKLKFGTNRTVEHREAIAAKLAERGGPLDREARVHVLDRIERARRGSDRASSRVSRSSRCSRSRPARTWRSSRRSRSIAAGAQRCWPAWASAAACSCTPPPPRSVSR